MVLDYQPPEEEQLWNSKSKIEGLSPSLVADLNYGYDPGGIQDKSIAFGVPFPVDPCR